MEALPLLAAGAPALSQGPETVREPGGHSTKCALRLELGRREPISLVPAWTRALRAEAPVTAPCQAPVVNSSLSNGRAAHPGGHHEQAAFLKFTGEEGENPKKAKKIIGRRQLGSP